MSAKNKFFWSSATVVLIVGISSIIYYIHQQKDTVNTENKQIENTIIQTIGENNSFLIDDNVDGLTGCTDQKIINKFNTYALVKKQSGDGKTYNIFVYDTDLDLSGITTKINTIKQKNTYQREELNKLNTIFSKYQGDNTGVIYFMYSEELDNIITLYKTIDVIHMQEDGNGIYECRIESNNRELYNVNPNSVDDKLLENLNKLLGSIISGNIDINYLPSLWKEKQNSKYIFTKKPYKDGILSIQGEGQDGFGLYIVYNKAIGNKIYTVESKPFGYINDVSRSDIETKIMPKKIYDGVNQEKEIKDLKCTNDVDCEKKANTYIDNLFNGAEKLAEYTQVHDVFLNKIDEIFGK